MVTVVGHAATIAAGEWITASGEWINDRTHGQQFKARFLRTSLPNSADGIEKYLSSGMIRGLVRFTPRSWLQENQRGAIARSVFREGFDKFCFNAEAHKCTLIKMYTVISIASDPAAWAALLTLIAMEVVLGIDNLIFIAILTNRLPEDQRELGRRIGIGLALVLRLGLLGSIAFIVTLTAPIFSIYGLGFSWRDLILIAGGLFLVWKATKEIHHRVDPDPGPDLFDRKDVSLGFAAAIGQIVALDLVFSIDSIVTAVGMTDNVPIMFIAVTVAVFVMLLAATPLAKFINANSTIVMLALGFLLVIGTLLIAEGFGVKVPKGYIYAAMAFSALVEGLNMMERRARQKRRTKVGPRSRR